MKSIKVLIYCYDYPPYKSVGALRPHAWAKYLHEYGIHPIVLTRKWQDDFFTGDDTYVNDPGEKTIVQTSEQTIIRIPYKRRLKDKIFTIPFVGKYLRKVITLIEIFGKWQISWMDEKNFLRKELNRELDDREIDLIIVTGEPFILFKHVRDAALKHDIPFILDYRDGWWSNIVAGGCKQTTIGKIIHRYQLNIERKVIRDAACITSVHGSILANYHTRFPEVSGHLIENGFDPEAFNRAAELVNPLSPSKFTILYTGVLYPKHNVKRFLEVVSQLVIENAEVSDLLVCVFIGPLQRPNQNTRLLEYYAGEFPQNFKLMDAMPHILTLSHQQNAQLLLKFSAEAQTKVGFGTKLYEYAATKNPILTVLATKDKSTGFFPEYETQTLCFSEEEIREYVMRIFGRWKAGESIKTNLDEASIAKLSRRYQTGILARKIKDTLIAGGSEK